MIFISAGHHPAKPGACFGNFCEHEEAKVWASLIAHHVGGAAIVVPTGTLRQKVEFINSRSVADSLAVEVHFNSATLDGMHVGKGCETLYYPGSTRGAALAEYLQEAVEPHFPPGRGCKEGWYQMNPAKGPDFFLAHTRCPAVIIEPEFIHRKAVIQDRREAACVDIARALRDYAAA